MYQRIFVPVDGSRTSMLGLDEAIGLAAEHGARLRILNVVDEMILMPAVDMFPMAGMDEMIESLRADGKKAIDEGARRAAGGKVTAECAQLDSRARAVSDVILSDAKKWRADLIVMGTHGRRGMNRLLLGSDAERVLREATVPVLLVRGEKRGGRKTASRSARTQRASPARSKARQRG